MRKQLMAEIMKLDNGTLHIAGSGGLPPVEPLQLQQACKPTEGTSCNREIKRSHTTRNRFRTLNHFVDKIMRDLKSSEVLVWFVLYRDCRDGIAKTSQRDIAARTGLRQATVSKAIGRLVDDKLIERKYQGGFQKGSSIFKVHDLPLSN